MTFEMEILLIFQVEKSQGEIYRLRAKLENTQSENENIQEEFDKIQQALSRSYAERDKYAGEMDKLREELERVQVEEIFKSGILKLDLMFWSNVKLDSNFN